MINLDKITRTKLAMLVTLVLMNIFTTIALYYSMTMSHMMSIGTEGDPFALNIAMIFAIVIAFMWVITLILFYEFKTDDIIKSRVRELEYQVEDLEEFKQMLKSTAFTPAAINPDVLKAEGVTGHAYPPK